MSVSQHLHSTDLRWHVSKLSGLDTIRAEASTSAQGLENSIPALLGEHRGGELQRKVQQVQSQRGGCSTPSLVLRGLVGKACVCVCVCPGGGDSMGGHLCPPTVSPCAGLPIAAHIQIWALTGCILVILVPPVHPSWPRAGATADNGASHNSRRFVFPSSSIQMASLGTTEAPGYRPLLFLMSCTHMATQTSVAAVCCLGQASPGEPTRAPGHQEAAWPSQ
jgi:hypothetical protein